MKSKTPVADFLGIISGMVVVISAVSLFISLILAIWGALPFPFGGRLCLTELVCLAFSLMVMLCSASYCNFVNKNGIY